MQMGCISPDECMAAVSKTTGVWADFWTLDMMSCDENGRGESVFRATRVRNDTTCNVAPEDPCDSFGIDTSVWDNPEARCFTPWSPRLGSSEAMEAV